MQYHYQCTHDGCRQRWTLAKRREQYIWKKKHLCPSCGRRSTGQLQNATIRAETRRRRCDCDANPWHHKRGQYLCRHYAGEHDDDWHEAVGEAFNRSRSRKA